MSASMKQMRIQQAVSDQLDESLPKSDQALNHLRVFNSSLPKTTIHEPNQIREFTQPKPSNHRQFRRTKPVDFANQACSTISYISNTNNISFLNENKDKLADQTLIQTPNNTIQVENMIDRANKLINQENIDPEIAIFTTFHECRLENEQENATFTQIRDMLKKKKFDLSTYNKVKTLSESRFNRMQQLAKNSRFFKEKQIDLIKCAAAQNNEIEVKNPTPICNLDKNWVIYQDYVPPKWNLKLPQHLRSKSLNTRTQRVVIAQNQVEIPKSAIALPKLVKVDKDLPQVTEIGGNTFTTQPIVDIINAEEYKERKAQQSAEEKFYREAEQLIINAVFPMDKFPPLAAYSSLSSLDSQKYKNDLLSELKQKERIFVQKNGDMTEVLQKVIENSQEALKNTQKQGSMVGDVVQENILIK